MLKHFRSLSLLCALMQCVACHTNELPEYYELSDFSEEPVFKTCCRPVVKQQNSTKYGFITSCIKSVSDFTFENVSSPLLKKASNFFGNAFKQVSNCVKNGLSSISSGLNSITNCAKDTINSIPNFVKTQYTSVYNYVKNSSNLIPNFIRNTWNSIYNNNKIKPISYKKPVRILSLDGGGTRGYIQAKFLELFCKDAEIKNLGDCFDLIAGTSVGGINAVALANGMTPKDMMDFFREKTPWIFTVRSVSDVLGGCDEASVPSNKPNVVQMMCMMSGKMDPFYKSVSENSNYGNARLRKEITNILGSKLLTSSNNTILLTAYNSSTSTPIVFTSTDKIHNIPGTFSNVKMVDALMAMTSAPNYFPSTSLKLIEDGIEQDIIDGSIFQNDPSTLAFIAAHSIYPSAKDYCILSLGTGKKQIDLSINEKQELQLSQYVGLLEATMQNAQITNDLLLNQLNNCEKYNTSYYRFNIQLDSNRDCSFDTSTSDFFDYLDDKVIAKYHEEHDKINQFINKLKGVNE